MLVRGLELLQRIHKLIHPSQEELSQGEIVTAFVSTMPDKFLVTYAEEFGGTEEQVTSLSLTHIAMRFSNIADAVHRDACFEDIKRTMKRRQLKLNLARQSQPDRVGTENDESNIIEERKRKHPGSENIGTAEVPLQSETNVDASFLSATERHDIGDVGEPAWNIKRSRPTIMESQQTISSPVAKRVLNLEDNESHESVLDRKSCSSAVVSNGQPPPIPTQVSDEYEIAMMDRKPPAKKLPPVLSLKQPPTQTTNNDHTNDGGDLQGEPPHVDIESGQENSSKERVVDPISAVKKEYPVGQGNTETTIDQATDLMTIVRGDELTVGTTNVQVTDSTTIALGDELTVGTTNVKVTDSKTIARGDEHMMGATSDQVTKSMTIARGDEHLMGATSDQVKESMTIARVDELTGRTANVQVADSKTVARGDELSLGTTSLQLTASTTIAQEDEFAVGKTSDQVTDLTTIAQEDGLAMETSDVVTEQITHEDSQLVENVMHDDNENGTAVAYDDGVSDRLFRFSPPKGCHGDVWYKEAQIIEDVQVAARGRLRYERSCVRGYINTQLHDAMNLRTIVAAERGIDMKAVTIPVVFSCQTCKRFCGMMIQNTHSKILQLPHPSY